jgi:hypothetical protein
MKNETNDGTNETASAVEDRFLKRFEAEFNRIMEEISVYSSIVPQYKTENESLRERLENIRAWAEEASKARYMQNTDTDAVLANLVTNILAESGDLDKLKPKVQKPDIKAASDELFQLLSTAQHCNLDEAMKGFDFYDNNPLKKQAEKKIAKIKKKKKNSQSK